MTTLSSILASKIPWTEEPGGLQSLGFQELEMTSDHHDHHLAREELKKAVYNYSNKWRILPARDRY